MHHVPVTIARDTARELWRAYQKHKHYSTPIDREVMSAYQKLAQGKLVIRALESVRTAGVDDKGLPKLAIARADAAFCHLTMRGNGGATMSTAMRRGRRTTVSRSGFSTVFEFPANTFPGQTAWRNAEALVPLVPIPHRPKRAMANYHILWEAEWTKAPPVDPFLLRRIGKSDMWLVLAMWDLTEVERTVLAGRL
ncbi:hypothetical protein [Bradyrhizobium sp. USDA 4508]